MPKITLKDREAARKINWDQEIAARLFAAHREDALEDAAKLVEAMSVRGPNATPWDIGRADAYQDAAVKIRALKGAPERLH